MEKITEKEFKRSNTMTDLTIIFFTQPSGESEKNYFFGIVQPRSGPFLGDFDRMKPGDYRVIDGLLYPIISGISPDEVRKYIEDATNVPQWGMTDGKID